MAADVILDISRLEVSYGAGVALHGLNLSVPKGSIVVLLGPNGAGKTTTLRAATGFLPGDSAKITDGEIRFNGKKLNGMAPHSIAKLGMVLVPERDKVFRTLTVEDNFRMIPMRRPREREELMTFIRELFPALQSRWNYAAGYLSGGEIQMLAIARSLLMQPEILLPDEASLGIAPTLVDSTMSALAKINKDTGMSILMAEQNAAAALEIAHYAYVLESGAVAFAGSRDELMRDARLTELYLGLGGETEAVTVPGAGL